MIPRQHTGTATITSHDIMNTSIRLSTTHSDNQETDHLAYLSRMTPRFSRLYHLSTKRILEFFSFTTKIFTAPVL